MDQRNLDLVVVLVVIFLLALVGVTPKAPSL